MSKVEIEQMGERSVGKQRAVEEGMVFTLSMSLTLFKVSYNIEHNKNIKHHKTINN